MTDAETSQTEHFYLLAQQLFSLLREVLKEKTYINEKDSGGSVFDFTERSSSGREKDSGNMSLVRRTRPPLPHPALVRRLIRQRRARERYFNPALFSDPAWDILLDLTIARAEHSRVSVTSLCVAAGVPPTTALRWIGEMVNNGLLKRTDDEADRRRAFIELSDDAANAMAHLFHEVYQP